MNAKPKREAPPEARLILYRCSDERREALMQVTLPVSPLIFGRGPDADVMLPDPTLPERFFSIQRTGAVWELNAISGSGIEVDGELVPYAALLDGNEIRAASWFPSVLVAWPGN